jgi:glutamate transport system substrate-binding protein
VRSRIWIAIVAAAVTAAACGHAARPAPPAHSRFYRELNLRIGVHSDEPGIGLFQSPTNQWSGLDISVADYIMKWLHIPFSSANPHFYSVDITDRDVALVKGIDDLVIASYSITDGRIREGISFTIPYLLSFQDILIRSADAGPIKSVDDLRGRKVCTGPATSTPYQHLVAVNRARHLGITIVPLIGDWVCVDRLLNRDVDAVVGDDAILYGYQILHPGLTLVGTRIWPRPEQYGVGFIAKTPADAAELNAAVREMIRDGSWAKAIAANFCPGSHAATPCREARLFLDSPPPA